MNSEFANLDKEKTRAIDINAEFLGKIELLKNRERGSGGYMLDTMSHFDRRWIELLGFELGELSKNINNSESIKHALVNLYFIQSIWFGKVVRWGRAVLLKDLNESLSIQKGSAIRFSDLVIEEQESLSKRKDVDIANITNILLGIFGEICYYQFNIEGKPDKAIDLIESAIEFGSEALYWYNYIEQENFEQKDIGKASRSET